MGVSPAGFLVSNVATGNLIPQGPIVSRERSDAMQMYLSAGFPDRRPVGRANAHPMTGLREAIDNL
jgi:hypothetical protein